MYQTWSELSSEDKAEIIRQYQEGVCVDELAQRYKLRTESLGRRLREILGNKEKFFDFKTYDLEVSEDRKIFIYSDCHFGEHDPLAVKVAIEVAAYFDPHIIINLGDTVDASRLSQYKKDPRALSIQQERELWFEFAESLNRVTRAQEKLILIGNHDARFMNAVATLDGFFEIPELNYSNFFYTNELGYQPPVDLIYLNRRGNKVNPDAVAYFLHGEFARRWSGTSVRATSEMFAGANTVIGHAHRTAMITRRTPRGIITGYEIGTLARLNPTYAIFPDWSQSVATGFVGKDYISLTLHIIQDGKTTIGDRVIVVQGE
jgi:hypothetical protein